jgi:hypothetical protein
LPHFLVNYNNLSQQILSLHILHFITAYFTFITAQVGYHCTLKLGTYIYVLYSRGESNILLIRYAYSCIKYHLHYSKSCKDHILILIRAALYPLCLIVSSVFQVPDAAMVEDSANFGWPNETSSEASSSGNCLFMVRL